MLKKAEEEKEKEKLVKKIVAENEAKEQRKKAAWIDQQMADPNFQLLDSTFNKSGQRRRQGPEMRAAAETLQ